MQLSRNFVGLLSTLSSQEYTTTLSVAHIQGRQLMFPYLTKTLTPTFSLQVTGTVQTLQDYNLGYSLPNHTLFDDLDLVSRSHVSES